MMPAAGSGPGFAGERVATLDEALGLAAELGLGANVEIKSDRAANTDRGGVQQARSAPRPAASFGAGVELSVAALVALHQISTRSRVASCSVSVPRGWAELAQALGAVMIGAEPSRLRPPPCRRDHAPRDIRSPPTPSTTRRGASGVRMGGDFVFFRRS